MGGGAGGLWEPGWDQREKGQATGESCEAWPGLVEAQVTVPADWGPSRPLAWGAVGFSKATVHTAHIPFPTAAGSWRRLPD